MAEVEAQAMAAVQSTQKAAYAETGGGWVKYAGNPVLGGPATGTCFDVFAFEEGDAGGAGGDADNSGGAKHIGDDADSSGDGAKHISGDADNSGGDASSGREGGNDGNASNYRLYFSWRPKKSLAVVTGSDGVHWSQPRVILEPEPGSGWEDDLNRFAVVKRPGESVYRMWYCGQARGHTWIGYATSPDGYAWARHSVEPVLVPELPWEGASVMCPHVLWDGDEKLFKMWYSAGETYEPDAIGFATSADGAHWRKRPANPVFTPDPSRPWERHKVGACQVDRRAEDGWYYMFYIGFEDIDTARICLARSPDGVTRWERHRANPIVSPTPGAWDGEACYKPYAVWNARRGEWLLWYNGRKGSDEYIGLATHAGFELGF